MTVFEKDAMNLLHGVACRMGVPMTHRATFCWSDFCKEVFYGYAWWPSYSHWIVPGTITDNEYAGWLL